MPTPRSRVYLAGPMFSVGDKYEQLELEKALKTRYEVHLPQRDGIEVASVMDLLNNPEFHGNSMLEAPIVNRMVMWVTRVIEALDVYQSVEGCDCVVLNLDGRVPDEGSLVEATLAWSVGRPVVPYKTTPITELGFNNNPMVDVISGWTPPASTPAGVLTAVVTAMSEAEPVDPQCLSPGLQLFCQLGRTIWQIRKRRNWAPPDVRRAIGDLQALPVRARNLIEPVPLLQPAALQVAVAIIEFGRQKPGGPQQQEIIRQQIIEAKKWSKQRGVRRAIMARAATA